MGKVLSAEEIARYERDGFLHPVPVLSREEATQIREALEQAEAAHPDALARAGRNNAHLVFPFLDAIVHNPRMLDIVEDLIGPDIVVWGTVLFIKEANDPSFVSWHQDFTYMGLEPHAGVSAWLALTPSTVETGCMRMLPGTHRDGIRPHQDRFEENNILTRGQTIVDVNEEAAVDLIMQPGEISLHHPRTMHSSLPNQSAQRRIGFTIQSYLPPEVRQVINQGHAQPARGKFPHAHMKEAGRPSVSLAPEDVATRDTVNSLWAELLYEGAERKRDL